MVASNFTQNAAIVPKIEQCRAVTLIFQSIHYLLCIYLSLSHKEKKSVLKRGPFMWRGFFNRALCSDMVELN